MKEIDTNKVFSILDELDKKSNIQLQAIEPNDKDVDLLKGKLLEYITDNEENKVAVLGIDIFKYSKYYYEEQKLIPIIFRYLVKETIENCFNLETSFSAFYDRDRILNDIIDTGDGGYFVFMNPIDAIVFSIYFNANLHSYNSFHAYPKLRKFIGPLTLRYAITYDKLYTIDNRYFGPAIINNSRIMGCDKLNRLLIDSKTYEWFLLKTNGIENITVLNSDNIFSIKSKAGLIQEKFKTLVFQLQDCEPVLQNVFCQKLDKVSIKEDKFDIYNLIIQTRLFFFDDDDISKNAILTTTIGNMNCNGI